MPGQDVNLNFHKESEVVSRRITRRLPRLAIVCLLAIVSAVSVLAQSKAPSNTKPISTKVQQSSQTTSENESAPVIAAAPKVDNAARLSFVTPLEKEIIDEINLSRTEPQKYLALIEAYKNYYQGNALTLPGSKTALVTHEGLAAVDDAINFLRAQKPLPSLSIARGMCLAAKDQARDMTLKGLSGHTGSDGSLPKARVDRYGIWNGTVGENIIYDITTARQMVIGMIIDDGVATRGHRRNIFDPTYRVAGVSISDAPSNGARGVIVYVGGFTERAVNTTNR